MLGSVAIRYPRGRGVGVELTPTPSALEIGRGEILREGNDLLILAIGSTVYPAIHAAERLENNGIHVAVVNARFLKPLTGSSSVTGVENKESAHGGRECSPGRVRKCHS